MLAGEEPLTSQATHALGLILNKPIRAGTAQKERKDLTSKMSHDRGWRAACGMTIWSLGFHFEIREIARGVTAMVVGSGALLGRFFSRRKSNIGSFSSSD